MSLMKTLCDGKKSLRGSVAFAAISSALLLAACGGTSAPSGNGLSDSEDIQSSSSSSKVESSSSVILSSDSHEESSSALSSSSWSSEGTIGSSSSSEKEPSSSSSVELNCSALLEGETGWSWNVPKECRFNPDIAYGTMIDSRDGQTYKTVKIGDQTWMAENLNFDPGQGGSGDIKYDWSWCYNDEPKNCAVAGRLYSWAAAIDSVKLATDADNPQDCGYGKECGLALRGTTILVQGICPEGWHLPTRAEWNALFAAVGDESTAGKVLKSQTGWYSNGNGTDTFGFSALPAGKEDDGDFSYDGNYAVFWSSTEDDSYGAYYVALLYGYDIAYLDDGYKYYGFSVRCLKDL